MKPMTGFINIYKSGHYHRQGKPGAYDRHPGDIYPTYEAAVGDIDQAAVHLYVGTAPVTWIETDDGLTVNPPDSEPVPIRQTRKLYAVPSQVVGLRPLVNAKQGEVLAIEYKPTHGGYPDA